MNAHKPFRVLIVDDEALIGNVIQNELEIRGHQVVGRAADGRQAVELAQSLRPDIILMDIVMPDMDGLEATRQIQEKCPCPVVLLTAHEDPDLVARAGQVGASAYLVKPPNGPELARTMAIARFEDLKELRRLNAELHKVLAEVKMLKGLLPICSYCKSIRDSGGGPCGISCNSGGVVDAIRSGSHAGWPYSPDRAQASASAIPACERVGRPSRRNSADSLPEDWDQRVVRNGELRIGSLRSWFSSFRRKTVCLSPTEDGKSRRIPTRAREVEGFCMCKMEEEQAAH